MVRTGQYSLDTPSTAFPFSPSIHQSPFSATPSAKDSPYFENALPTPSDHRSFNPIKSGFKSFNLNGPPSPALPLRSHEVATSSQSNLDVQSPSFETTTTSIPTTVAITNTNTITNANANTNTTTASMRTMTPPTQQQSSGATVQSQQQQQQQGHVDKSSKSDWSSWFSSGFGKKDKDKDTKTMDINHHSNNNHFHSLTNSHTNNNNNNNNNSIISKLTTSSN